MAATSAPVAGYDLDEYERLLRNTRNAAAAIRIASDPDDIEDAIRAVELAQSEYEAWVYAHADALFRELKLRRIRARA